MLLAEVPRSSRHEEKIGAFLMSWAEGQGLSPVQDAIGNVVFDVPATEGMESLAPTILQAHMDMVRLVAHVIDGVYTMSPDMTDLVESSSNLGIFTLNEDVLLGVMTARSSLGEKETEILETQLALAEEAGYEVEAKRQTDPWPYDPDSKLLEPAKEVYKEQNGEDIEVAAVHAGLECGTFKNMKPDLDMISIGPDLKDIHTPEETLYLNSIPKTWHLLEGILARSERAVWT